MKDKKLVVVEWLDANATQLSAFAEHEIPHSPMKAFTLGWLLRDDAVGISVANEWFEDNTYRGVTFIPRAMILAVHPAGGNTRRASRKKRTTLASSPPENPRETPGI